MIIISHPYTSWRMLLTSYIGINTNGHFTTPETAKSSCRYSMSPTKGELISLLLLHSTSWNIEPIIINARQMIMTKIHLILKSGAIREERKVSNSSTAQFCWNWSCCGMCMCVFRLSFYTMLLMPWQNWPDDWLIEYVLFYLPLKNISLIWRRQLCRWRAAKFRPIVGAHNLWACHEPHTLC
jgi:hypothetical protein